MSLLDAVPYLACPRCGDDLAGAGPLRCGRGHSYDVARQGYVSLLAGAAADGALVLAVTHDLGLAARFADEVLVMREGTVAAHAAPETALASDVLRDVFGIEAFRAACAGRPVLVPWAST